MMVSISVCFVTSYQRVRKCHNYTGIVISMVAKDLEKKKTIKSCLRKTNYRKILKQSKFNNVHRRGLRIYTEYFEKEEGT